MAIFFYKIIILIPRQKGSSFLLPDVVILMFLSPKLL